jgi:hypothetical protein
LYSFCSRDNKQITKSTLMITDDSDLFIKVSDIYINLNAIYVKVTDIYNFLFVFRSFFCRYLRFLSLTE